MIWKWKKRNFYIGLPDLDFVLLLIHSKNLSFIWVWEKLVEKGGD